MLLVSLSSSSAWHIDISCTDSRGIWATYQLISLNSSLESTPISENLHLRRFTMLTSKNPSARDCLSVVSLGTSLALLAGSVEGTEEISLQIWDLSYGVLLATQSMPVPFGIPSPHLSLTVGDQGQVLLTVSPSSMHEKVISPRRSSVHIVPVRARLESNIAAALGKTALTAEWLVPKTSQEEEDESAKIISDVRALLQKKHAQKAEQAFLKWVDSHSVRMSYLPSDFVADGRNSRKRPLSVTNLSRKFSTPSWLPGHKPNIHTPLASYAVFLKIPLSVLSYSMVA